MSVVLSDGVGYAPTIDLDAGMDPWSVVGA
jgi:hypothetical protein